jgi:hypothetical protein
MDLLAGARVLITLLFGVDILLVGLSVYRISHSAGFACLGAILLAVSDLHLGVYSFALSEPLFLTLMLAAFLLLSLTFDHPHWSWPLLTGLLLSLAYLTRYAGVSLIVTTGLVLALLKPSQLLKRMGFVLAGALLPILAWMIYGMAISGDGSLGNRQFVWHPISFSALFEAFKNLLTWIAPNDLLALGSMWGKALSLFSLLLIPALIAWLVWVVWRRFKRTGQQENLPGDFALAFTQALHIPVYLVFMIISLTLFDASTPLNDRILAIIYVPEIILFSSAVAWLWNRLKSRPVALRWALAIFCLLLVAFSVKDGYAAVNQLGREGQGFTHRGISDSPAIRAIRIAPQSGIYSNKPGAIFLLTGRTSYVTPTPIDPVTGRRRSNYSDDLIQLQQRVKDGDAILVLFGLRNSNDPPDIDLFNELSDNLTIQADYGEIVIFGASP